MTYDASPEAVRAMLADPAFRERVCEAMHVIRHDVSVEGCHSHDHAGLGLHPGSGSQRPTIRDNRLENNDIGLFFCWGVRDALAEKNRIEDNRSYGISIGHRDTDNLIRGNEISDVTIRIVPDAKSARADCKRSAPASV